MCKGRADQKKTGILTWPLIRGVVNFGSSMVNGVKALMYSADFFPEAEGEPSKFETWLEKKLGSEKLQKVVVYLSVVLGVALSVGLFYSAADASCKLHSGAQGTGRAAEPH